MKKFVEGKVESVMTKDVITVTPEMTIKELETLFNKHGFNMFPVVDHDQLLGLVSEYDFLKAFVVFGSDLRNPVPYEQIAKKKTVKDVYTNAVTVRQWHPLTYVLELIAQTMRKSFPVVDDDGKLVGVIARRDLIEMLKAE